MLQIKQAYIAKDASLSGAIDLEGGDVQFVSIPTGWIAAGLSFQASFDGVTYQELYTSANAAVAMAVTVDTNQLVAPGNLDGLRFIKIRSGTLGGAVAQTAAAGITITLGVLPAPIQ